MNQSLNRWKRTPFGLGKPCFAHLDEGTSRGAKPATPKLPTTPTEQLLQSGGHGLILRPATRCHTPLANAGGGSTLGSPLTYNVTPHVRACSRMFAHCFAPQACSEKYRHVPSRQHWQALEGRELAKQKIPTRCTCLAHHDESRGSKHHHLELSRWLYSLGDYLNR